LTASSRSARWITCVSSTPRRSAKRLAVRRVTPAGLSLASIRRPTRRLRPREVHRSCRTGSSNDLWGARCGVLPHCAAIFRAEPRKSPARLELTLRGTCTIALDIPCAPRSVASQQRL
jgi:hypothetical protein